MPFNFYTSTGQQKTFNSATALAALGAQVPLYDVTLGAAAANIDIQNISQLYAHLVLEIYCRGDSAVTQQNVWLRFNNDSGTNYDYQRLAGGAASASADETFAAAQIIIGNHSGSSGTANVFSQILCDIAHYANTANQKTITCRNASKSGTTTGNLISFQNVGFWRSNSAINRITVLPAAGNFAAGTRVTLYGLGVLAPPSPGSVLPVTYGTSLPATPLDGQEAILVDSTTNPSYQWRFRYNANSSSSYKWEFVGGAEVTSEIVTSESTTTTTYTDLSTVGPSITVPRAGDYILCYGSNSSTGQAINGQARCDMSPKLGSAATNDNDRVMNQSDYVNTSGVTVGNNFMGTTKTTKKTLAAGDLVKLQYKTSTGTGDWRNRFLTIIPVRVS